MTRFLRTVAVAVFKQMTQQNTGETTGVNRQDRPGIARYLMSFDYTVEFAGAHGERSSAKSTEDLPRSSPKVTKWKSLQTMFQRNSK
eukprot:4574592-Amphidinium_carterae.2